MIVGARSSRCKTDTGPAKSARDAWFDEEASEKEEGCQKEGRQEDDRQEKGGPEEKESRSAKGCQEEVIFLARDPLMNLVCGVPLLPSFW